MTPDLISLLIQIPIVAAFIWYSLEMNKRNNEALKESQQRFLAALDRREESFEKRNQGVINAMSELTKILSNHDLETKKAIATMDERTKTRVTRRKRTTDE